MKNNTELSFIIINYNCHEYVIRLINSLRLLYPVLGPNIIVVDNNSSERQIEEIGNSIEGIKVFLLKENVGFSKANNLAVKNSESKYLVFVNPDVLFIEDCVSPIVKFMETSDRVGACAPKLLNNDLTVQDSVGFRMGLVYEFAEAFFLINIFRRIYRFEIKTSRSNPARVGWLSGAFLIMKKKVFEAVGGFDSDYFLNYEDIDLCRRLQEKNYYNYYFPNPSCIHYSNESFKNNYTLFLTSQYKSRRLYAEKHYNASSSLLVWLIHVTGLLLRILAVHFFCGGIERIQRFEGYKESLKFYFVNKPR